MRKDSIRKFLVNITPPILRSVLIKYKDRKNYLEIDKKYWSNIRESFEHELTIMVDTYLDSDDYAQTTKYWRYLLRRNLESIREFGVETFGQHAARNYYTWTEFSEESIKHLRQDKVQSENLNIFTKHNGFSFSESIKHNILIQLQLNLILNNNRARHYLQTIDSAGFTYGGHPQLQSKYGNLTLDLLSSIIEIDGLSEYIESKSPKFFLEIGAGSGRSANAILELNSEIKYVIADIPPASYLAMSRLRYAFPDKKIYFVFDSSGLHKCITDYQSWDILFVLPSLLIHFPPKFFDLALAIDCLHEMSAPMRNFFAEIASSKSSYYYFKIWNSTTIPLDNLYLSSQNLTDFGCKSDWKNIFSRSCKFPSNFSEFLFETS